MTSNRDFYISEQSKFTEELASVRSRNHRLSLLRLLFFVLIIVFLFVGLSSGWGVFSYILPVVFLVAFIYLCIIHGKSKAREIHLVNLISVVQRYVARIDGDFSNLPDKGSDFEIAGHDYAGDLDVFGNVSLFALYNLSATAWGRQRFAKALLGENSVSNVEEIYAKQNACEELMSKLDMLIEYEACAVEGKSVKMPEALLNLSNSGKSFSKIHLTTMRIQPLLWLVPLSLLVIGNPYAGASVLLVAVVNLIIWFLLSSTYADTFKAVDGISRQVNSIAVLYDILEKDSFDSELLNKLSKGGAKEGKASTGLKVLAKACSTTRLREQPILALLLNAIVPYDIYCGHKLNDWSLKYGEELRLSIDSLSQIECLMSCSCVGIISAHKTFPKFVDVSAEDSKNAYFEGEMITHPLINPSKVVSNSIKLDGTTALITGSNMSGKTTLIRTVGICCVLAYMGAPVPADNVLLGRMRIVSSMRIVDSIEEQMSTFRAELVRIAGIVKAADEKMPMLYLIDEIFRGTNSKDRTDGAMTVLTRLAQPFIIGMMTTHDYALCDMSSTQLKNIVYYHFSEKYDDNGITFDYKLRDGISHESNATFLMRLVGIK